LSIYSDTREVDLRMGFRYYYFPEIGHLIHETTFPV